MPDSSSFRLLNFLALVILGAGALATFALFLTTGFGLFWADSEIWAVTTSRWLFARPFDFSFGMKPLFHALLHSLSWRHDLSGGDPRALASLLDDARALMILNSTWLFFTLLVLGRRLTSSWIPGAVAISLLLLSDFFVDQMWRIRSDLLAIPWLLLALVFIFENAPRRAGACALAAFWLTPKAALILLAFLPILRARGWLRFGRASLAALGGGFALLAVLQGEHLLQALGHFINETRSEQMGMSMTEPMRWQYVLEAFATDPWFWLSGLVALLAWRWLSRGHRALAEFGLFTALASLALIVNPSKLPFLVASFQPIYALAVGAALYAGLTAAPLRTFARGRVPLVTVLASLFLASAVGLGVWLKKDRSELAAGPRSNASQRFVLEEWNLYLMDFPGVNAYDGLGLALRPRLSSSYVGPGQLERNLALVDHLREEDYLLIAETQKVFLVENAIRALLEERYRPSPAGLWRRSLRLKSFEERGTVPLRTLAPAVRRTFGLVLDAAGLVHLENTAGEPVESAIDFVDAQGAVIRRESFPLPWARLLEDERLGLRLRDDQELFLTPFPMFGSATGQSFLELFRFLPVPQRDN